jgi:hypothetical protein
MQGLYGPRGATKLVPFLDLFNRMNHSGQDEPVQLVYFDSLDATFLTGSTGHWWSVS